MSMRVCTCAVGSCVVLTYGVLWRVLVLCCALCTYHYTYICIFCFSVSSTLSLLNAMCHFGSWWKPSSFTATVWTHMIWTGSLFNKVRAGFHCHFHLQNLNLIIEKMSFESINVYFWYPLVDSSIAISHLISPQISALILNVTLSKWTISQTIVALVVLKYHSNHT